MDDKVLFNNINTYRRITLNNYDELKECEKNIIKIDNAGISMGPDAAFFGKLLCKRYEYAAQIIIFSALVIEAFLNDYLLRYLGNNYFDALDKLEIKNKLIIGVRIALNKDFPKDKKAYSYFSDLINLRNKLVHCKSLSFDSYINLDNHLIELKSEDVDKALLVYELIINELLLLQPDLDKCYLTQSKDLRDWHYLNCI